MIEVKVPATSANIGSGFDVLGLAVDIYNTFYFEDSENFSENNLILKTYKYTFDLYDKEPIPIKISQDSHVPRTGGLGSSSTCILAGISAALIKMGMDYDKDSILKIATDIEGHPDNVAPASFGGLVASRMDKKIHHIKYEVSDNLEFYVITPDLAIRTEDARRVLPKQIPLQDGIANVSSIVFLIEGLEKGDIDFVRLGVKDRFHQPYRKDLIPGYEQINKLVDELGGAFYLSGAGSALMVIADKSQPIYKEIQEFLNKSYPTYGLRRVHVNKNGYEIKVY